MLAKPLGLLCVQGFVAYIDLSWFVASWVIANAAVVLAVCILLRRYPADGSR